MGSSSWLTWFRLLFTLLLPYQPIRLITKIENKTINHQQPVKHYKLTDGTYNTECSSIIPKKKLFGPVSKYSKKCGHLIYFDVYIYGMWLEPFGINVYTNVTGRSTIIWWWCDPKFCVLDCKFLESITLFYFIFFASLLLLIYPNKSYLNMVSLLKRLMVGRVLVAITLFAMALFKHIRYTLLICIFPRCQKSVANKLC